MEYKDIKKQIIMLYALETKIFSERDVTLDLVSEINRFHSLDAVRSLDKVDQYLFRITLDRLTKETPQIISGIRFPIGGMNPELLNGFSDEVEYFRALLQGYSNPDDVIRKLSSPFDVDEMVEKQDAQPIISALVGSFAVEPNKENRMDLLRVLASDFAQLGEEISYGRVKIINPYLPDLMKVEGIKRWRCLQDLLDREYPFIEQNRYDFEGHDKWANEIRTLAD